MVAEPTDKPVTTPAALMVATDGVAELHVPPVVASVRVVVAPIQTLTGVLGLIGETPELLTVIGNTLMLVPQILVTE